VAAIEALGRKAAAYAAAVDDRDACQAMVDAIERDFGPVGILVNNAGIASRGQAVAETDPLELERVMRVHALGPHALCQRVIPAMRKLERGDVVMISSIATQHMNAGGAPYNMAKAAMEALAFTLAREERPHGIHVNVVAPGLVETEMGRRLMKSVAGVEDLRKLDAAMPFGRVCQPEDVANVVRFLVSESAAYITGERLYVHGGGR